MAAGRGRAWFDRGCEAFKRSFPESAAMLPFERFYVCPICLRAFDEVALKHGAVTREHAPPESVGGTRVALTCKPCNESSGAEADSVLRREADMIGFATGALREVRAEFETAGTSIPIRLSVSGDKISMAGVPWATRPADHRAVMEHFARASAPGADSSSVTFSVSLGTYSPNRAAAGWLRSAYVLFFAALGYRFIWRPELDVVRERIQNPESDEPVSFRLTRREKSAPTLCRIDSPEPFRSYAMLWGHHAVFLPRFNDRGLYGRLATMGEVAAASISGIQYPWPKGGPTFLYDFAVQDSPPSAGVDPVKS